MGAGPNLSSTDKSTITLGRPTYRLLIVDWASAAPPFETSNRNPAPSTISARAAATDVPCVFRRLLVVVIGLSPAIGRLVSLGDNRRFTKIT